MSGEYDTGSTEGKMKIMQHYLDGGEIEFMSRTSDSRWRLMDTIGSPKWNWGVCNYRIKPKVKKERKKYWVVVTRAANGYSSYTTDMEVFALAEKNNPGSEVIAYLELEDVVSSC